MQQRNKKNHSTNLAKTLLLVGALSSLTPVAAFAKEVKIPVSISGVGGTVSIVSKDNNESYDLSIPDNGTGSITIVSLENTRCVSPLLPLIRISMEPMSTQSR